MTHRLTRLLAVTVTLISITHCDSVLAQYVPPIILQTPTQNSQLTPTTPQLITPLQGPSLKDLPTSAPKAKTVTPAAAVPAAPKAKAATPR